MASITQTTGISKKVLAEGPQRMGELTRKIERQTTRIPSAGYLGFALGSMVASAILLLASERKEYGTFVGLWAPAFLLLGIYNKLVRLEDTEALGKRVG